MPGRGTGDTHFTGYRQQHFELGSNGDEVTMLKRKLEVNYRRSSIRAEGTLRRRCKFCVHKILMEIKADDGGYLGHGYRCQILGLEHNRRYTVEDGFVCNEFKMGKPIQKEVVK
jgi:hypothetical protein